ncbi:hypothetical protein DSO57_1025247 [Entomophthora muscae]|uniref:Uncharacterized protein n=1 Tax=Entomophthora muscae TaxID=34485 RepID=A0ACC2T2P8_9FUNG|nr:hypothetical protein DSO57_1025247 [Entomophthora muscae]
MDPERLSAILSYTSNLMNMASLLSGLLVITIVMFVRWVDKRLLGRLSLRLALAISITDVLRAIAILINKIFHISGTFCTILALSIPWLTLVYIFLAVSIALNLQLVILKGKPFRKKWEPYYWGLVFFSSTLIVIFPLVSGRFGYDRVYNHCTYRDSQTSETYNWKVATQIFWILAGCMYCGIVVIMTIFRVKAKKIPIDNLSAQAKPDNSTGSHPFSFEEQKDIRPKLERLIRSITLYCTVPIVTHTGFCILTIHNHYTGEHNPVFMFWSVIGLGLPGTLNFIVFLMDPSLSAAVLILRRRGVIGGVNYRKKKTSSTPLYLRSSINNILMNHQSLMPKSNADYQVLAGHGQLLSPGIMKEHSIPPRGVSSLKEELTNPEVSRSRISNQYRASHHTTSKHISTRHVSTPNPTPEPEMPQAEPEDMSFKPSRPPTISRPISTKNATFRTMKTASSMDFLTEDLDYSLGQVNFNPISDASSSFNFPPPPRFPPTNSVFFSATQNHDGFTANRSSAVFRSDPESEGFNLPFATSQVISSTPNRTSITSAKTASTRLPGILNSIYYAFPQLATKEDSRPESAQSLPDKQYIHPEMDPSELGALLYDETETLPLFYEELFRGL